MTLGRSASSVIGVVHTVNDPESVLKQFISEQLTTPALFCNVSSTDDIALPGISIYADDKAIQDARQSPSPAARSRMLKQRDMAKGARRNEYRNHYSGSSQRLPRGNKSWLTLRNVQSTSQLRLAALLDTEENPQHMPANLRIFVSVLHSSNGRLTVPPGMVFMLTRLCWKAVLQAQLKTS